MLPILSQAASRSMPHPASDRTDSNGLLVVIKVQVIANRTADMADRFIGFQIQLFAFHASPHALDEPKSPPYSAVTMSVPARRICIVIP